MTDFSEKATQLSAPQGAGSQPLSPVQEGAGNIKIPGFVEGVVDIFAKGLKDSKKEEADRAKNAVLSSYTGELSSINDALVSGQMKPSEASARRRAVNNKYAAGHSDMIKEINEAHKFMSGETELGEAEREQQSARELDKTRTSFAQQRGHNIYPGMSPEAKEAAIVSATTAARFEHEQDRLMKLQSHNTAQDAGTRAKYDHEQKQLAFETVNHIAATSIDEVHKNIGSLAELVKTGKMHPDDAQRELGLQHAKIRGALQAAARVNPELAAPYTTLFGELNELGKKTLDPKNSAENYKAQYDNLIYKTMLVGIADPSIRSAVAGLKMMPGNVELALKMTGQGLRAMTIMANAKVEDKGFIPQVVGDSTVEPQVLDFLKSSVESAFKSNDEKAIMQVSNSANQILKQTSKAMDLGVDAKALKGVAGFCASTEFATLVTKKQIDRDASLACMKTLQVVYEPLITNGVTAKLASPLMEKPDNSVEFFTKGKVKGVNVEAQSKTTVGDVVEMKFVGSGIVFEPKKTKGMELQEQLRVVKELKSAQAGVNQLIHIGAHMEGTTNYSQYWEANKHILFPAQFPDPEAGKPKAKPAAAPTASGSKNWWEG